MVKVQLSDDESEPDVFCLDLCKCLLSQSYGASELRLHGLRGLSPKRESKSDSNQAMVRKRLRSSCSGWRLFEHAGCALPDACTMLLPILCALGWHSHEIHSVCYFGRLRQMNTDTHMR